jgi:uncharacterized protein YbjT (DUF2867 family)
MRVLVTGSTGNVGKQVIRCLQERGVPLRAAVRRPGEAASLGVPPGDEVLLDFGRPETFAPALEGVTGLFLLRPPAISRVQPTLNALVDVGAARGLQHVVFLSVVGAGSNPVVPHHRVEKHLRAGPLAWTLLRPGFFAQNLGDAYRQDIREGRLFVPAGDGRVAFVDVRDVAEVAARAFTESAHRGQAYDLTGPEAITFDQVADILSRALARPIRYERAAVLSYARHLARRGYPLPQVAVQTVLHVGLRFGQGARVDGTLPRLLGRPARPLATYVADHLSSWT